MSGHHMTCSRSATYLAGEARFASGQRHVGGWNSAARPADAGLRVGCAHARDVSNARVRLQCTENLRQCSLCGASCGYYTMDTICKALSHAAAAAVTLCHQKLLRGTSARLNEVHTPCSTSRRRRRGWEQSGSRRRTLPCPPLGCRAAAAHVNVLQLRPACWTEPACTACSPSRRTANQSACAARQHTTICSLRSSVCAPGTCRMHQRCQEASRRPGPDRSGGQRCRRTCRPAAEKKVDDLRMLT